MAKRSCFQFAVALIVFAAAVLQANAAESYKDGDRIEVFFLNKWWPAVAVGTNMRGEVTADYEFAGGIQRKLFKNPEVRWAYESGAISKGRLWSDATGAFKIKAALTKATDKEATLRKPDLSEVTIEIDKLAEADREFLKRQLKTTEGERGVEPPPLESFELGDNFGSPQSWGYGSSRPAINADPSPAFLKLKQGGVGFPQEDFFDRLGAVLPVGGPDAWLIGAVENDTPGGLLPSRLYWASLARQKIERRHLLPPGEKLVDYHPPSRRALTFNMPDTGASSVGTLTVWEATPTDKAVKPIVRWLVEIEHQTRMSTPWARLIDGTMAVHRADKQRYVVWDIAAKKAKYQIIQGSFFAPEPVVSGGRKQFFLPEDEGVRVIDMATGKWLTTLPSKDGASAVAVSDDGKRAAVLGRSTLAVWDLTTADKDPEIYQAEAIGTPFTSNLYWVGADRIMADTFRGQGLFSLKNRMVLWHYDFDHNAVSDRLGARVREILDRHLVYAATFRFGGASGLAVGAVQLPGPRVDEAEAALDRGSLYIVKPGTAVSVVINAGEDSDCIQKALEEKIIANGWTLAAGAGTRLIAEMKRGDAQTVQYRLTRFGGEEKTESASLTPYISSLKLQVGDQVAWQSGTSSGAPPMIRLREGQSVQEEIDRWQKPNAAFFGSVKIPDKILDPKLRDGLGKTLVTNRGLVPK